MSGLLSLHCHCDVSSTYTEPLAAVAEKFATENTNGDMIEVPTFPLVESSTNVVTPLNWVGFDVIELYEINAAVVAVIVALASEIPALVPDASRTALLAVNVAPVPNDMALQI